MNSEPSECSNDAADPKLDKRNVFQKSPLQKLTWLWSKRLALFGAFAALGIFAFSHFGRYFFLAEIISNFRAQLLVLLLASLVVAMLLAKRKLFAALVLAILWCSIGVLTVWLPGQQPLAGSKKIKIMSFNVWTNNRNPEQAIKRILEADPDILTVVEYANDWKRDLQILYAAYPYRKLEPRWHGFGVAIFSKIPLGDTCVHQITAKETDNPLLVTNVNVGEQTIRLVAVHVVSPTNSMRLGLRNQQLAEVASLLAAEPQPTVVMGDFNCTPSSPFLADFLATTGYRDSRQGFGYQSSWNTNFPMLRIPIDHAFVSDSIHVHDRYVAQKGGSDHYPIVFEISVAEE